MAEKTDKSEKKKESPAGGEKPASGREKESGGLLTRTPVLVGGVMLIEAIVLFAGFKFLGGAPHPASGAQLVVEVQTTEQGQTVPATGRPRHVEVPIVEFRAPNKQSGRTFLYDVAIFAVAKAESADQVKQTIKEREALIKDRIRTIIAQSDPEKLGGGSEPGLETLRRQVKYQLDEIIGEGMIDEVLVPRCIPFRTDF